MNDAKRGPGLLCAEDMFRLGHGFCLPHRPLAGFYCSDTDTYKIGTTPWLQYGGLKALGGELHLPVECRGSRGIRMEDRFLVQVETGVPHCVWMWIGYKEHGLWVRSLTGSSLTTSSGDVRWGLWSTGEPFAPYSKELIGEDLVGGWMVREQVNEQTE